MWRCINLTGYWEGEVFDKRKNGEIYSKWLSISTVLNDSGKVAYYVGTFSDISERTLKILEIERSEDFDLQKK